jgi:hypothetical protein
MANEDMKVVSMERTEAEKKAAEERYKEGPVASGPDFPWGLCINLGKDELAKLGIKELPEVGDEFHVYAVTRVTRVSASASEGGEDSKGVELQITHMGAMQEDEEPEAPKGFAKAAQKLYGKAESE